MKVSCFILVSIFCLTLFNGCRQKSLTLDLKEIECKNLELKNATGSLLFDACNNSKNDINQPLTQTIKIRFEHGNKRACLDFVKLRATFKNASGGNITNVTYKNEYLSTDPEVTLTDSYMEVFFTYTLSSQLDADNLRTVEIELYSENEVQNRSNKLNLVVSLACQQTTNNGIPFNVVQDVRVFSNTVNLSFRDYSAEDGDIIDVYLNGTKVISNLMILNNAQSYNFPINTGTNTLVVIALNEGSSSPNTCEVTVNNGSGINLTPGLSTGQAININF